MVVFLMGSLFSPFLWRSDVEYSDDHCHLVSAGLSRAVHRPACLLSFPRVTLPPSSFQILPDSEAVQVVQGKRHRGKHKFKVKEMYLTKLLSTKVHFLFPARFHGYLGGTGCVHLNFRSSVKMLQISCAF